MTTNYQQQYYQNQGYPNQPPSNPQFNQQYQQPGFNQYEQQYPNQYPPQQAPQVVVTQPVYVPAPQDHSDYDIYPQNDPFLNNGNKDLSSLGFNERNGFIRKVYSILSAQLLLTFALCLLAFQVQGWRDFLVDQRTGNLSVFSWCCFAIMFITEIAILCGKNLARQTPNNYIALFLFTFCFGVLVAGICGAVYNALGENGAFIVMAAALLTLAVTLALTIYAFTTKSDFTMMGGALFIILAVLLVLMFISWFNRSVFVELIISGIVVICYGFYLIYDTQLIMGGKAHELSIDDYVIGALLIYVDIIILFLRILEILLIIFGKRSK